MPEQTSACNQIGWESHCPQCGAEYRNIQHPMKPLGVIMRRECDCVFEYQTQTIGVNSVPVVTQKPPEKSK